MKFTEQLRLRLEKAKDLPYYRKTNNESGPAAPLHIEDARDWEITWKNGRAILLNTPRVKTPKGEDMPKTPDYRPDLTWDRGGSNTGTMPTDPNAPMDQLKYVVKDSRVVEGKCMSYVERLSMILAANPSLDFMGVLKLIKPAFPELKMQFTNPPTYIWNPKKKEGSDDDKAKLEPQKIKDSLKVKLPQLKWTLRMSDGVEEAELGFSDESTALFEIGLKANHLTITFTEAPKEATVEYDDSESEDEDKSTT